MNSSWERRLATTVSGVEIELPVLLAPTGALGVSHWRGDVAAARAAEAAGTRLILSSASSWSIEEVAAATRAVYVDPREFYSGGVAHPTMLVPASTPATRLIQRPLPIFISLSNQLG